MKAFAQRWQGRHRGWPCAAVLALAAAPALADPKVCGDQAALGMFAPASCPLLHDDGVAPDDVKGDGIFSAQATLTAAPLLQYKILPSGSYDGTEIGQTDTCDSTGGRTNPSKNILVESPDVSQPVRFYYDSRHLADPSYAPAPDDRSAGDSVMTSAPKGAGTQWVAVGDFQDKPFDAADGVVDLVQMAPGLYVGETIVGKVLPTGWQWKVLEKKGTYDGARKYGPNGWSYPPCDSANVVVSQSFTSPARIQFVFHAYFGRLQTLVTTDLFDDPAFTADLSAPSGDGAPSGMDDADMGDGGQQPLPGIHCNCRVGGRRGTSGADPGDGIAGALLLLGCGLILLRRRQRPGRTIDESLTDR